MDSNWNGLLGASETHWAMVKSAIFVNYFMKSVDISTVCQSKLSQQYCIDL